MTKSFFILSDGEYGYIQTMTNDRYFQKENDLLLYQYYIQQNQENTEILIDEKDLNNRISIV